MAYKLDELFKLNPVLKLDGLNVELSLLTLKKQLEFKNECGSLENALDKINKEPSFLFYVLWIFVIDKSLFNNSFTNFSNRFLSIKNTKPLTETAAEINSIINGIISSSMPLIKNQKRQKEIQEINKAKGNGEGEPCYAGYFDDVASRYGYSKEDFLALTLGELHIILKTINDKKYDELEVQAALMNKKLKPRMVFEDITEEEEQEQEEQAMAALAKLQKRYEENNPSEAK